jgi:hypothetical protein
MNSDKQRIAIAEYCGWKDVRGVTHLGIPPENGMLFPYPEHHEEDWRLKPFHGIPDYLNDLNAMHEAEKMLYNDKNQSERYAEFLLDVLEVPSPFIGTARCAFLTNHATAAQRAEAFLKTIGKWEDGA